LKLNLVLATLPWKSEVEVAANGQVRGMPRRLSTVSRAEYLVTRAIDNLEFFVSSFRFRFRTSHEC